VIFHILTHKEVVVVSLNLKLRTIILFTLFVWITAFSQIVISHESGFYDHPIKVEITSTLNGQIFYTTDGSEPKPGNEGTEEYSGPIIVSERKDNVLMYIQTAPELWIKPESEFKKATVLRIIEVVDGKITDSTVRTYFIGIRHTLPVVSIIVEPGDLFDYEKGIYVPGKFFDPTNPLPLWTGNYYQKGSEWERRAVVEYLENGELKYRTDVGLRIHGEFTRSFPVKSLRLYARNKEGEFTYPFFGRKGYKKLLLRNSGNDWDAIYMRDAVIQNVFKELNFDTQDSYPVIHYINGEYWGVTYLMEYYDQRYLQVKHGVSEKNTVIINYDLTIQDGKEGTQESFVQLLNFVKQNDLSKPENYQIVENAIDIDNFIDFKISEIIAANTDWPGNNERMWRVLKPENTSKGDGKWRWMMYDMDLGFWQPEYNTLKVALYGDPNVPWTMDENATILLRKLLENEEFKKKFIERFDYILNVVFEENRVIGIIDKYADTLRAEINQHSLRWGKPDISTWEEGVEWLKEFVRQRPSYVKQYLKEVLDSTMK
jgi:hypothetical protein